MSSPFYVIPPAGVTAVSFFVPVPFIDPARPPPILADKIDPRTGDVASLFVGMDPIDAAVAHQFRVRRGSGVAVIEDGQDFASIRKNDESAPQQIRFEIERIFRPFVERGDVTVEQVIVEAGEAAGDFGAAYAEYVNNVTGARRRQFGDGTNQEVQS